MYKSMNIAYAGMYAHYEKQQNPKQQKFTSPQVLLRTACAHIMKKFTLTLNTLICKLIIIKLMVAVVMLFIFICPFIFILFVSPG